MRKIIIIFTALSVLLAGCGVVHDPSSSNPTEETGVFEEANVVATEYDINASLIKTAYTEEGYTYTVFVGSNNAYAVLQNDCVQYLDGSYKQINEVFPDVKVTVYNINKTSINDTLGFVKIESPKILDTQKVFISVFGTTQYIDGMIFESIEQYKADYGAENLVSVLLQISESPFYTDILYNATRPIYESIRLINKGNGYDIIHISTENTKSHIEDGILWTPVDITNMTDIDYSNQFADILNNAYVATGNINGKYEDIKIMKDTNHKTEVRLKNNLVEVGITNYTESEEAPNCVVANIILGAEENTLNDNTGRRAIIIFFN